jgi:alpha/beta superfamily hydrolase
MNPQTRRWTLAAGAGAIEVAQDDPAQPAIGTAVIAHPHPLFGGTMDNKVVQTLARAFVQCGWTSLRFNFRGVGASTGVHDAGKGEADDLLALVQALAPQGPLALAGFSFGAFVTAHALARLEGVRDVAQAGAGGHGGFGRFERAALPAAGLHSRTLVIHGETDDTVPLSDR